MVLNPGSSSTWQSCCFAAIRKLWMPAFVIRHRAPCASLTTRVSSSSGINVRRRAARLTKCRSSRSRERRNPTQDSRLLCQLSASWHQAPFVLPSNVTPQPAIAIEVSQFANDIQISVTSCVSYGFEPPGRVVSPTVSVKRILRSAKYSSEAAFFSSSAISEIVRDASSVFRVSPDKPLLPIPFCTGASTSLCVRQATTETIGRQLTHMLRTARRSAARPRYSSLIRASRTEHLRAIGRLEELQQPAQIGPPKVNWTPFVGPRVVEFKV